LVTMAERVRIQSPAPRLKHGTPTDVEQEICDIIAEQLGVAPSAITDATSFEDMGADIADMAALIVSVEEAFGVQIRDEDVDLLLTVGDFVTLVKPAWFRRHPGGPGSIRT
jgi:acyl carrier protein